MGNFDGFDYVIELSRRIHEQRNRTAVADRDKIFLLRQQQIDEMIDDAIARFNERMRDYTANRAARR